MKTKRKYQRLAPSVWAKICGQWEIGDVTLAELSDRFGVNTRTLQAHFAKHAVVKGSKAAQLALAVKEELFLSTAGTPDTHHIFLRRHHVRQGGRNRKAML
jgi:hypothetical protein